MRFTDNALKRIRPGLSRQVITETGVAPDMRGLQLRVSPSGAKTFQFRYKLGGETRYMVLGNYPAVSLADAHAKVTAFRRQLRDGNDPAQERERKVAANKTAPTVQAIYEDFRDHYLRKKRKRPGDAEAILENHILAEWKDRKARSITRRDVIERARAITENSGPRIAEVAKGLCGQMFNYAVDMGLLDASPASRLPVVGSRGEQRERVLDDDEIRQFWGQLTTAKMDPETRAALRLLLVTGQRRQEIALARWTDLDGDTWTIPAEHSKNGRAHVVPLSRMARALVDELALLRDAKAERVGRPPSAYVVPSRLVEDRPVDPQAITRAVGKNQEHFGVPAFTPHDLRRTCASGLSALGVQRLHVMKVLNHVDPTVTAIYDRHDYMPEKRAALDQWAAHLQAVLAGKKGKVTPIAAGRSRRARQRAAHHAG